MELYFEFTIPSAYVTFILCNAAKSCDQFRPDRLKTKRLPRIKVDRFNRTRQLLARASKQNLDFKKIS